MPLCSRFLPRIARRTFSGCHRPLPNTDRSASPLEEELVRTAWMRQELERDRAAENDRAACRVLAVVCAVLALGVGSEYVLPPPGTPIL
jgi:hypothetical protein